MKFLFRKTAFWLTTLTGIGLLYIGFYFYVDPVQATSNYGIHTSTGSDYSFHHIKGIRDFVFGVIILWLLFRKQYNTLGWLLIIGSLIPIADFGIVISNPGFSPNHLIAHIVAIVFCLISGIYYAKNYKPWYSILFY